MVVLNASDDTSGGSCSWVDGRDSTAHPETSPEIQSPMKTPAVVRCLIAEAPWLSIYRSAAVQRAFRVPLSRSTNGYAGNEQIDRIAVGGRGAMVVNRLLGP